MTKGTSLIKNAPKSARSGVLYPSWYNSPLVQELTCNDKCEPTTIATGMDSSKQSNDCESNFDFSTVTWGFPTSVLVQGLDVLSYRNHKCRVGDEKSGICRSDWPCAGVKIISRFRECSSLWSFFNCLETN